jgi:long-chain fatty acid transport protein
MKKVLIATALLLFTMPMVFGTILTNTNQSVMYMRLPSRNASTLIDAVYYNPAGVMKLENGFHLAIHNQSIWQDKTVISGFPYLNDDTYVGEVRVPLFPSLFAVFKQDKLALSFGFGINSGGGSADFASGLPSFEIPISLLPAMISGMGIPTSQYSVDMAFEGMSYYLGFQGNISFALSDAIAVAGGVRYIYAISTYEGYLENIQINPQHPLLNPSGGMMSAEQFFTYAGYPAYAAMVSDSEVDVEQTGSGFTPILGVNISPNDSLNIGIRYEFNTKLELTNDTTVDDSGLFPDGRKFRNDLPAILSVGVRYAAVPEFRVMVSLHYFFDKSAVWEQLDPTITQDDLIDSNSYDFGVGFEYDITDSFLISAGYLYTNVGVSKLYQSDFSHELDSHTFGGGGRLMLTPHVSLDFAGMYGIYTEDSKNMEIADYPLPFLETYQRDNWALAIGIGFHL